MFLLSFRTEEEEIDIDLNDPEVADAAMKIQAGFRGFKARKEVQSKVRDSSVMIKSCEHNELGRL